MKIFRLLSLSVCLAAALSACKDETVVDASISPAKQMLVFAQEGGEEEVTVESTVDWRVNTPADATWCQATRLADQLRVTVDENTDSDERSLTLELYCEGVKVPVVVEQLGTDPAVKVDRKTLTVAGSSLETSFKVVSNVEYDVVPGDSWITVKPADESRAMQTNEVVLQLERNTTGKKRTGSVTVQPKAEEHKNLAVVVEIVQNYSSQSAEDIKDVKVEVTSVEADQQEQNQESGKQDAKNMIDGDVSTFYHSPWSSGKTTLPVTLTFRLKEEAEIDYLIYTPRQDSNNGAWGKTKVSFAYNGGSTFTDAIEHDFGGQPKTAQKLDFGKTMAGVTAVKIEVSTSSDGLVTCAELGFYRKAAGLDEELERIFADKLCTELKPGIGEEEIAAIQSSFLKELAQRLHDGGYEAYDKQFRVQEYLPYRPVNDLQDELKTQFGYNQFENPTGIFFNAGEDIVVFVDDTKGETVSLKVYDFYNKSMGEQRDTEVFPLSEGINVYKTTYGGLTYVEYYTDNYKVAQPVKAHVASGQVNGYYEKGKSDPAQWQTIINNADYGHFDLKGENVNLCFPVSENGGLRQYCKDPDKLIGIYDKYVGMEFDMMGIKKYGRTFPNHMFIRTVAYSPGAAAYCDNWGVGTYNNDTDGFNDETCAINKLWMITHEFGHANQIDPYIHWVGLGEVTNNCYAVCIRHEEIPWYEKFEDEKSDDGRGSSVAGGLINKFINQHMLDKNASWIITNGDAFIRLCPLWQLLCYYRYVETEHKDWYGDLIEKYRDGSGVTGSDNGGRQVAFMKNTCDVLQADLTDFFENAGMLRPCDAEVDDYTPGRLKITEMQCEDVKTYAKKYKKPEAMLNYMSANAIRIFKEKASVSGTYGSGVSLSGTTLTVDHNTWKNAVAFETYEGETLTAVSVMGTGRQNGTSLQDVKNLPLPEKMATEVYYPANSTAVYAVSWDGKRTLVYGASNGMENK